MKRKTKPKVETTKHYEHQFRRLGEALWGQLVNHSSLEEARKSVKDSYEPSYEDRIVEVITTRRVVK